MAGLVDEDVLRFDVAMQHAVLVQVCAQGDGRRAADGEVSSARREARRGRCGTRFDPEQRLTLDREQNLAADEARGGLGQATGRRVADVQPEVAARAEVHHQVEVLLGLEGGAQLDDERVIDLGEDGALGLGGAQRRATLARRARMPHARLAHRLERHRVARVAPHRLDDAAIPPSADDLPQLEHRRSEAAEQHLPHGTGRRVVGQVERALPLEDARGRRRKGVGAVVLEQDLDDGSMRLEAGPVERRHARAIARVGIGTRLEQRADGAYLAVPARVVQRGPPEVVDAAGFQARLEQLVQERPLLVTGADGE